MPATKARDSSLSRAASVATPGRATHTQTMAEPLSSSGTPTTAHSTSFSVFISRFSSSDGPVRLPETLIVSSERPRMYQQPSASRWAKSPCTHRPGITFQ